MSSLYSWVRPLAVAGLAALALPGVALAQSGTLTIGSAEDGQSMDPQMYRHAFSETLQVNMRNRLWISIPPLGQLVPQLAESMTQVDDTHYDVKLRQGVHFHNGEEMTSEDVVFTYKRLWDPANKSPRANMGNMANVENIEAIDRYTVRWTTKVPFGPVEQAIRDLHVGGQEILPKSVYENMPLEEAAKGSVVGAGPFQFVEWIPNQRLVMKAFPDYFQGPPGVETVIWRVIPEESTRVAELLAGSVDLIGNITPDSVDQLKAAGMKFEIVASQHSRYLQMNVREGSPFADLEVRKAMNKGIDRKTITESLYKDLAVPFNQMAGVAQEGYIQGYDPFPFDPEAARAVLSKVTQPVELFTNGENELYAEAIAEQLRGYGMNVSTVIQDSAALEQKSNEGTFDLMLTGNSYGGGGFVTAFYNNHFECSRLTTGKQIRTGFCDESIDALVDAARAETDPAKRGEQAKVIAKRIMEEGAPWVNLFGPAQVWAMQPYVNGFIGGAGGLMDISKVTLDK